MTRTAWPQMVREGTTIFVATRVPSMPLRRCPVGPRRLPTARGEGAAQRPRWSGGCRRWPRPAGRPAGPGYWPQRQPWARGGGAWLAWLGGSSEWLGWRRVPAGPRGICIAACAVAGWDRSEGCASQGTGWFSALLLVLHGRRSDGFHRIRRQRFHKLLSCSEVGPHLACGIRLPVLIFPEGGVLSGAVCGETTPKDLTPLHGFRICVSTFEHEFLWRHCWCHGGK